MLVSEVDQDLILLEFLLAKLAEQPPLFPRFLLLRVFLPEFYQEQLLLSELLLVFLLIQILAEVLQGLLEDVLIHLVHLGHGGHAPSLFPAASALLLGGPRSRHAPEHFLHGGQVVELAGGTATCRKSSRKD